jgi:hypothetical protein
MTKTKYQGNFNWYGEEHKLYTWAYTKAQAKAFFCKRLSIRLGISITMVANYFNGQKSNFQITEESTER